MFGAPVMGLQFHPEVNVKGLPNIEKAFRADEKDDREKGVAIFTALKKSAEAYNNKKDLNQEIRNFDKSKLRNVNLPRENTQKINKIDVLKSEIETNKVVINIKENKFKKFFRKVAIFFKKISNKFKNNRFFSFIRNKINSIPRKLASRKMIDTYKKTLPKEETLQADKSQEIENNKNISVQEVFNNIETKNAAKSFKTGLKKSNNKITDNNKKISQHRNKPNSSNLPPR